MNFHYLAYTKNTTHRPETNCSHFNEDAHCDNEVNLILEKNNNQPSTKKSIQKQQSIVVNQSEQYYFMPIREQNSTTTLTGNNVIDLQYPSTINSFDEFSSLSIMNLSDRSTTVNKTTNYSLTDDDLAALFVSSLLPTTPSNDNNNDLGNNTLDDVFLNQMTDLVCGSPSSMIEQQQQQPIGPPPGFESFLFKSSSTSDLLPTQTTNNKNNSTISSINNVAIQTPVSSSDTINFSQLLQSTTVDSQEQQPLVVNNVGNIRSSTSSHSSFTSDDQSIFFPISTHPYSSSSSSSYASSQIFSTNTPSSSATINSTAKPHIPNSLSLNNNNNNNNNNFSLSSSSSVSLVTNSTTDSPISSTLIENDKRIIDGGIPSSHIFSFFSNGHTDYSSSKFPSNVLRTSSSSASSSTSSSIDDALIQLTQQQQQNKTKLFTDEPTSIFHLSKPNLDKQQQAVHDNINFLASMAQGSTTTDTNINLQRSIRTNKLNSSQTLSKNLQELMENLNELCYKGFDELNALIQEQRWVQSYVNINPSLVSSPNSPSGYLNNSNSCSSRILIVCEYFIFKCKKIEITASQVFELLANGRAELRLRDLLFVFKSWKESILVAEKVHQEEENKLRLSTEHPQSYYMTDTVLQSAFDRVVHAIRQLCNLTQQARAAFQYATLNVFQTTSRQQSQPLSTSTAQLQAMQQQKSSSMLRTNGSIRTTP